MLASSLLLLMSQQSVQISPLPLPSAVVGEQYCDPAEIVLEAQNGTPPYSWQVEPGSTLPQGMSLSPEGVLCGVPQRVEDPLIIVRVVDSGGVYDTNGFRLRVEADGFGVALSVIEVTASAPINRPLSATGGMSPITWTLHPESSLPPGVTLSASGIVQGRATETGVYPFAVTAEDARGATASRALALHVIENPNPLRDGGLVPSDDAGPAGSGGGGLARDRGGCGCRSTRRDRGASLWLFAAVVALVSGRRRGWFAAVALALVVFAPSTARPQQQPLRIVSAALPDARIDASYSAQLSATGAATWLLQLGRLPSGLTLDTSGRISGTPTEAGVFRFVIEARSTDPGGVPPRDVDQYELVVEDDGAVRLEAVRLSVATRGGGYEASIGATGGLPPYDFQISDGRLPTGLIADTDVVSGRLQIVGQPTEAEIRPFLLEVEDSTGRRASRPYVVWVP